MSFTPFVRLWLLISAFAGIAGWTLSACGQLNRAGYAIGFGVFVIFLLAARRPLELLPSEKLFFRKKFRRRFGRPLPLCFATLTFLIFLGGMIYAPTHYTALCYHIPRVLNWLAAGEWHWIHTPVSRMNYPGCAFEWLTAPVLLFTGSDRGLFVINFIPFLLMPGLVYSVFTRLGVRARVAWQWMWLLPTGYGFLLQAGSAGNDAFSVLYALAAVDFGCRAWKSRRPRDLWFSLMAAALLTGTKPTSLPLLLPWFILILPLLPVLRQKKLATLAVLVIAIVISYFPTALMNKLHCGDWLGTSIEPDQVKMQNPLTGILGNGFELLLCNFVPPFFPQANWWNQHGQLMLPHSWLTSFQGGFFQLGELPTEDWAGAGFGISVLISALALASLMSGGFRAMTLPSGLVVPPKLCRWVLLTPWIALLAYSAKAGMATPARLIAPYYPLLLLPLLVGAAQAQIIRHRWWQWLVAGVLILAFFVLMLSPDRPLWPAKTILSKLHEKHPDQRLINRALKVYTLYSDRSDSLAGVRALVPREARTVGFIGTEDDVDISLWRPFGGRRVEHFFLTDPPEEIRRKGVQYVVVGAARLAQQGVTFEAWRLATGAELVATTNAIVKVAEGFQPWYVVRLNP